MKAFYIVLALAASVVRASAQPAQCTPLPPVSCGDLNAYEMKDPVDGTATVCTPFACGDVTVQRTKRLFVPIDPAPLNGQHYLGYEIRSETYDESANPSNLTLQTLYGLSSQNLQRQTVFLVVPAGKTIPPDAPPALRATSDGFLCFKPSNIKFGMSNVTTLDQFGTQTYVIHRVAYTCVNAGINAPAPATATYLLGIANKQTTLKVLPNVNIIDIFHPGGALLPVDPVDELVANATVVP